MTNISTKRTPTNRELMAAKQQQAVVPATAKQTAVAINKAYRQRYLDEVAPASIVGRMIKFGKDGTFTTTDDGEPIASTAEFAALCDQTLVGWLKFNGAGESSTREMGLIYGDYVMPPRESLGDLDVTKWEEGLNGEPADPWAHHMYLVLQDVETSALYTFDHVISNWAPRCGQPVAPLRPNSASAPRFLPHCAADMWRI